MNPNQLPEGQRQRCEVWTRVMGYHRPWQRSMPASSPSIANAAISARRDERHAQGRGLVP